MSSLLMLKMDEEAMSKNFGMDEAYRLPKLNSEAAELPRYRYADERLTCGNGAGKSFAISALTVNVA